MSAVLAMFYGVQLLEKELDDRGQQQLRIVCDSDMDDKLSARELGEHFPRSVSLVQQVRGLPACGGGIEGVRNGSEVQQACAVAMTPAGALYIPLAYAGSKPQENQEGAAG